VAIDPVVVALNRAGEAVAHRVAAVLGAHVHGRAGRVDQADVFFPNALEHVRALFAAGTPVVGVCAAGILIRAVAPLLVDKMQDPPVVAVSDDGAVVVPLLGGHRGANALARQISQALGATAAVTTAGDVALGIALDAPPPGWRLMNRGDAKAAMAALLAGEGATVTGDAPWLVDLPRGDGVRISVTRQSLPDLGPKHLQFAPQMVTLGVGCARDCAPAELLALVEQTLAEAGVAPQAGQSVNTLDLEAD